MGIVVDIIDSRVIVEWVGESGVVTCVPYGASPNIAISDDRCRDVRCVLRDIGVCRGVRI